MENSPLRWSEIEVGTALPDFVRKTDFGHWNRYAAVNDEFVPMHMDPDEGRKAGQRDAFGMGNLRIAYLHNLLRDWLGRAGDIASFSCQFRGYNFKGDELRAHARVEKKEERAGTKLLRLALGVVNQEGFETTPASAEVFFFEDGVTTLPEPGPAGPVAAREASENIPQALVDMLGETASKSHSYPIAHSDIRRWAQAVYYPEEPPAVFVDEAVAARGPHDGIVAPREFNPFAWTPGASMGRHFELLKQRRPTTLNGGQRSGYYAPMRPGDVITRERRFADVYEKQGRSGSMVFSVGETRWTNQRGELVRLGGDTLIFI